MFQDEARFGRRVRPKRCWAPAPLRPVMGNGYEREFVYVYGAVRPLTGELDGRRGREMNTAHRAEFLAQVSHAHPADLIVMVLDGASSHKAKDLPIPANIRLLALPPYAPELNPRRNMLGMNCARRSSPTGCSTTWMPSSDSCSRACPGSPQTTNACRSLTAWSWIVSLNLKAH